MNNLGTEDKKKVRKDQAKKAIALAMKSRWEEAVVVNRSILKDFTQDLEAYNRLGKAYSELGRNPEAKEAFQRVLEISPNNPIAGKNLDRLMRLGDETPAAGVRSSANPNLFIEESGQAKFTSLVNLALPEVLVKLAPGYPVELKTEGGGIRATQPSGEYVGQVEAKLASRLTRLIKGGNRYEATVTSVGEQGLTVIIREVYRDPSQIGIVSFPSQAGADYRVYLPSALLGSDLAEEQAEQTEPFVVKDWSDDDTEPGDDEAFTLVFHRIIKPGDELAGEGNEDEEDI